MAANKCWCGCGGVLQNPKHRRRRKGTFISGHNKYIKDVTRGAGRSATDEGYKINYDEPNLVRRRNPFDQAEQMKLRVRTLERRRQQQQPETDLGL